MVKQNPSIGKYDQTARVDNRKVQRQISSESSRQFALIVMLGFFLVLGLSFNGWVRWKQTEITYHINKVKAERERLIEKIRRLETELSIMKSPYKTEQIATELGLVQVTPNQIIRVSEGN